MSFGIEFLPHKNVICIEDIDTIVHVLDIIERHAAQMEMRIDAGDYDDPYDYDADLADIESIRSRLAYIADRDVPRKLLIRYDDVSADDPDTEAHLIDKP